tara:strand:+ start:1515 stop:1784 length:270 start_codon:yes stop_codon:yes gene_type:complete
LTGEEEEEYSSPIDQEHRSTGAHGMHTIDPTTEYFTGMDAEYITGITDIDQGTFEVRCTCGDVARFSLRTVALNGAIAHSEYHANRAAN